LINGDRNTTFFQRRANTRRKKNIIIKLRDDCDLWITEQEQIANKFTTDFSKRFKSSHYDQRTLPYLGLQNLISDEEKSELIRLPNLEEVKTVLFSIDSNNTQGPDGFRA